LGRTPDAASGSPQGPRRGAHAAGCSVTRETPPQAATDLRGWLIGIDRCTALHGEQDMNESPSRAFDAANSESDVAHWLTNDTRDERFLDDIFAKLCVRLQRADIPIKRASLHLLIYHPQWLGARIMWTDGMAQAEYARVDYDVRERSEYIGS